jgi:hypothetical protein
MASCANYTHACRTVVTRKSGKPSETRGRAEHRGSGRERSPRSGRWPSLKALPDPSSNYLRHRSWRTPCDFKGTSGGTRRCDAVKVPGRHAQNGVLAPLGKHHARLEGVRPADAREAGTPEGHKARFLAFDWWASGGHFGAKLVFGNDQWAGSFVLPHVGRRVYSIAVLARRLPELARAGWILALRATRRGQWLTMRPSSLPGSSRILRRP